MSISLNCKKKTRNFWKAAQEKKKTKPCHLRLGKDFLNMNNKIQFIILKNLTSLTSSKDII